MTRLLSAFSHTLLTLYILHTTTHAKRHPVQHNNITSNPSPPLPFTSSSQPRSCLSLLLETPLTQQFGKELLMASERADSQLTRLLDTLNSTVTVANASVALTVLAATDAAMQRWRVKQERVYRIIKQVREEQSRRAEYEDEEENEETSDRGERDERDEREGSEGRVVRDRRERDEEESRTERRRRRRRPQRHYHEPSLLQPHSHLHRSDIQLHLLNGLWTSDSLALHHHTILKTKAIMKTDHTMRPYLMSVDRVDECECDGQQRMDRVKRSESFYDYGRVLDIKVGDVVIQINITREDDKSINESDGIQDNTPPMTMKNEPVVKAQHNDSWWMSGDAAKPTTFNYIGREEDETADTEERHRRRGKGEREKDEDGTEEHGKNTTSKEKATEREDEEEEGTERRKPRRAAPKHQRPLPHYTLPTPPRVQLSTIHPSCPIYTTQILVPNLACAAGVVHIVDEMLMPSLPVAQTMGVWKKVAGRNRNDRRETTESGCECRQESIALFTELMQKANMSRLLNDQTESFTVFAPSDSVLLRMLHNHQFQFSSSYQLYDFIASHIVVNGTVLKNELQGKQMLFQTLNQTVTQRGFIETLETELTTLNGQRLLLLHPLQHRKKHIVNQSETNAVTSRTLVSVMSVTAQLIDEWSDVLCSNGVIHVIDGTLYNWRVKYVDIEREAGDEDDGEQRLHSLIANNVHSEVDNQQPQAASILSSPQSSTSVPQLLFSALLIVLLAAFILFIVYIILRRSSSKHDELDGNDASVDEVIDEIRGLPNGQQHRHYGTIKEEAEVEEKHRLMENGMSR